MRLKTILNALYPAQCMTCDAAVEENGALCGPCWRETRFLSGLCCDQCGIPLPGDIGEDTAICDDCTHTARGWRKGTAALHYSGSGRRIVMGLKHGDRTELARPAAQWMARRVGELEPDTLVIPVPLHWYRYLKRRYNQSALLARYLAEATGTTYAPLILQRVGHTESLDGKTKMQRFDILSDAIRLHPKHGDAVSGRPVLIVDDVMTSGATLSACAEQCQNANARHVDVAVLARVAKDA